MKEWLSQTSKVHRGVDKYGMRKPRILGSLRPTQFLFGLPVLVVLTRLTLFAVYEPFIEGDTELLIKGHVSALRKCLQEGRLRGCPDSGVWPLFQNLAGLLLSYLGFSSSSILPALAYLSFLSFLGSVLLIFWTLKRKASLPLAGAGALIVVTSPLLWYSHSTYGEMAAAFLTLAFTAACLLRARAWIVVALFILAGSTKEIAFPFLLLIGLLCLLPDIITNPKSVRSYVYGLGLSAALTLMLSVAFNYFRFATISNPNYVTGLLIVSSLRIQTSFFFGIWFSPNGGLFFFWPSFVFLYFSVIAILVRGFLRMRSTGQSGKTRLARLIHYLPIITISVVLFLLTAGFARWFTPLGGAAWGPRYMLPWIPAVSLLLLYFYREEVTMLLRLILGRPLTLVLTGAALIVFSMPQFSILFGPFVLARIFSFPECPRIPIIQEGITYYYQCIQTQIWPSTIFFLELYRVALKPPALWFAISCSAVVAGGLLWVRKRLAQDEIGLKANCATGSSREATVSILRRAANTPARYYLIVIASYSLVFLAFFSPAIYHRNPTANGGGISWFKDDMRLWLGSGCNEPARNSAAINLPAPVKSSGVAIVSRLACSSQVPDGTEVALVRLIDADGKVQTRTLIAGRDSSEWAYDCGSVKPHMRHQRANIFSSYPAKMDSEACEGHSYATRFSWDGAKAIKRIEFNWIGEAPGSVIVEKLSLINDEAGTSYPIDPVLIDLQPGQR